MKVSLAFFLTLAPKYGLSDAEPAYIGQKEGKLTVTQGTSAFEVLTAKSAQDIIAAAGTGEWVLDRDRTKGCAYVVCCRNGNHRQPGGPEPHGSAFLVGKISDVIPAPTPGRWIVCFDEYAEILAPGTWQRYGQSRNPIRYTDLVTLGIDPAALVFKPVASPPHAPAPQPEPVTEQSREAAAPQGLTIAQAKAGLAQTFGVDPDKIEIIIRG